MKKKKKKKITLLSDFKQFITRGNILDLAVAVVIGGAFGKIVTSLVNDIIMPLISLALGGVSFADMYIQIKPETTSTSATVLHYGNFIQSAIDFLIIAVCIFLMIRVVSNVSRKLNKLGDTVKQMHEKGRGNADDEPIQEPSQEEAPATQAPVEPKPTQEELLTQIRDLLKQQNN